MWISHGIFWEFACSQGGREIVKKVRYNKSTGNARLLTTSPGWWRSSHRSAKAIPVRVAKKWVPVLDRRGHRPVKVGAASRIDLNKGQIGLLWRWSMFFVDFSKPFCIMDFEALLISNHVYLKHLAELPRSKGPKLCELSGEAEDEDEWGKSSEPHWTPRKKRT